MMTSRSNIFLSDCTCQLSDLIEEFALQFFDLLFPDHFHVFHLFSQDVKFLLYIRVLRYVYSICRAVGLLTVARAHLHKIVQIDSFMIE